MKKIIPLIIGMIISAAALLSTQVQADVAGFQVGTSSWQPDYSGTFANGTTAIDIQTDLGFSDDSHSVIWLKLEHPVPVVPNFKITSNDLSATSSSTLTRDINYEGQDFLDTTVVNSQFDMTNTELTLYYELLDNWINLDMGLTLRQYDGQVSINNAVGDLDFALPLLYIDLRIDLPMTGLFIDSTLNTISAGDNEVTETMIALGYESDFGLGGRLGIRTLDLAFDESNLIVDLEFEGAYLDLFYHF